MFDLACRVHGITHYLIDPGKPAQNGKVEQRHRTSREELWNDVRFCTIPNRKRQHATHVFCYNTEWEHLGIVGKTPAEYVSNCSI
jgi:transposase InsO family protein